MNSSGEKLFTFFPLDFPPYKETAHQNHNQAEAGQRNIENVKRPHNMLENTPGMNFECRIPQ